MPVNKPLGELKPGEKGRITKVSGDKGILRRLRDMGVIVGSEVEVERVAPLGDPVEVKIKGYHLAIRKEEALGIVVETNQVAGNLMPLALASPGEVVKVADIKAGRGLGRRLADMGLTPGTEVVVIDSHRSGPVVVQVRGAKLALGHGMAQKILVTR